MHKLINADSAALKLFTTYALREEAPGTLHRTKAEVVASEPF